MLKTVGGYFLFTPHISCSEYIDQFNPKDIHLLLWADVLMVNNEELMTGWLLVAAFIVEWHPALDCDSILIYQQFKIHLNSFVGKKNGAKFSYHYKWIWDPSKSRDVVPQEGAQSFH